MKILLGVLFTSRRKLAQADLERCYILDVDVDVDVKVIFVMLRTLAGCVGLGLGLIYGLSLFSGGDFVLQQWLALPSGERALHVLLTCGLGFVGYVLILLMLGVRPRHFLTAND